MIDINTATPGELEQAREKLAHQATENDRSYVRAQEAFDILDDAKKAVFAAITEKQGCKTTAEAERRALISQEWRDWMVGYAHARHAARVTKLESEATKRLWDTCRSVLASKNTERRMA